MFMCSNGRCTEKLIHITTKVKRFNIIWWRRFWRDTDHSVKGFIHSKS